MEQLLLDDGRYLYLPHYNKLINSEFKDLFRKFGLSENQKYEQHYFNRDFIQRKLKNLGQIIFQITQDCNLRCKYCIFSGKYYYKRNHTNKNISFEVAKEGINKIYDLIKDRQRKEFALGFYGGEPMLNVSIIKNIVAYAEKRFRDFKLSYYLTTNGTLVNLDHLDFFLKKNFKILISLDGPKAIHDRHRVFRNDTGSHDVVMANLLKIKSFNETYYYGNINLIATFPDYIKISEYYDFFENNPIVNELDVTVGLVDSRDTCFYDGIESKDNLRDESVEYLFQRIKYKCNEELSLSPIEKNLIKPYKKIDEALTKRCLHDTSGTCLFDSRVFVDCHGMFHVCEKIGSVSPIGNVQDGFDLERMQNMLNRFCELVRSSCATCNVRSFCRICFANIERNGEFVLDSSWCREKRDITEKMLSEYIELKREGVI